MASKTMRNTALAAALATGIAGSAPSKPAEAYTIAAMAAPAIIQLAAKMIFSSALGGQGNRHHDYGPFEMNPRFDPTDAGARRVVGYEVRSPRSPHNAYIRECRDGTLAARFQGRNFHITPNQGLETLTLTPVEGNPCAYEAERGRHANAFNNYGSRANGRLQSMRVPLTENVIGDKSKVEIYLGIAHKDGRLRSEYGIGSSDIRINDTKDDQGAMVKSAYDFASSKLQPEVFEQALRNAVPKRTKTHRGDWQTVWNVWTEINRDAFNELCGYGTLKMDREREPRYGADVCERGKPTPNGRVLYGLQIVVPPEAMKEPFRMYVPGPRK